MTAADVRYANLDPAHQALVDRAVARMGRGSIAYEDSACAVLDTLPYGTPEEISRWHDLASLAVDIYVHATNSADVAPVSCKVCAKVIPRHDESGQPIEPSRYERMRFCSRACRSRDAYVRHDRTRRRTPTCTRCGTTFETTGYTKRVCDGCRTDRAAKHLTAP